MRALFVLTLVVLAGCATAPDGARRDNRNEITRPEIEDNLHLTALDLVRTERPHWLRSRGRTSFMYDTQLVVYLDGIRYGGAEVLAYIQPMDIQVIRYYDAGQAQQRFGIGHTQGAIDVITRK
jgi:hypothetical protein